MTTNTTETPVTYPFADPAGGRFDWTEADVETVRTKVSQQAGAHVTKTGGCANDIFEGELGEKVIEFTWHDVAIRKLTRAYAAHVAAKAAAGVMP